MWDGVFLRTLVGRDGDLILRSQFLRDTTSFFFTNFPDNFGEVDMWKIFSRWVSVGEVFIPPKRDKFGKRFGFVRFKFVENSSS